MRGATISSLSKERCAVAVGMEKPTTQSRLDLMTQRDIPAAANRDVAPRRRAVAMPVRVTDRALLAKNYQCHQRAAEHGTLTHGACATGTIGPTA